MKTPTHIQLKNYTNLTSGFFADSQFVEFSSESKREDTSKFRNLWDKSMTDKDVLQFDRYVKKVLHCLCYVILYQ